MILSAAARHDAPGSTIVSVLDLWDIPRDRSLRQQTPLRIPLPKRVITTDDK